MAWNRHGTNTDSFLLLPAAMLLQAESEIAAAAGRSNAAVEGITNLLRLAWVGDGAPRRDGIVCMTLIRAMALDSLENLQTRGILSDSELASIGAALRHTRREGTMDLSRARVFNSHLSSHPQNSDTQSAMPATDCHDSGLDPFS